jgi:hypothetical protein
MAMSVPSPRLHRPAPGRLARRLFVAAALTLIAGSGPVHATWFPKQVIIGYQLVDATPKVDGIEYVFRARLLNLGSAIPGAVARLAGDSQAATIVDDTLTFGPTGHLQTAWSLDTAAIRRHGRWIDILSTLRWSILVGAINRPPIANAGPDRAARVFERVVLDGSGSADPDGDSLTYRWSWELRPAGSVVDLPDASAVRPEFTLDVAGRYVLSLAVHDGTQWSSPDVVEVATENTAPVARAGDDRTVVLNAIVRLDGSASSDADGDTLAFGWQLLERPAGSQTTLDDPAAVRPSILVDAPGRYVVRLTVHDGLAASAPDDVVLRTDNSPPIAAAGPDRTVPVGQQATLDGSGSTDVDGQSLTYAWSLLARPVNSVAALQNAGTVAPSFVADLPGTYVAQLIVNDGFLDSAPDTVTISTANSAPLADAGSDQTIVAGQVVVLDGTGSADPDGDPLSYRWMLTATAPGSTASIADPAAPVTSFIADRPGDYAAQLVVNDGLLDSAPDTVVVSTTNSAPVADAGPDQADVPLASPVPLDGRASSDADGHPLTYSWSLLSRPAGSLAALNGPTTVEPTFVPDALGDYVVQLIVNDGFADSAPDTVRVSTANVPPVADAGPDQRVDTGETVRLDGSASTDPEGMPLRFAWSLVGRPAASTAALSDTTISAPTFVADVPGRYVIELAVSDGALTSGPDVVEVIAVAPVVSLEATDPLAAEAGADTGTFTLTRTGGLSAPLVVEIALGGTGTNGTDYDAIGTNAAFAAGEATASVTITPIPDVLIEGDETVVLALVDGIAYDVGTPATATVTIVDAPVITIEATDAAATEAGDTGTFTIRRLGNPVPPLAVNLMITGTATNGVDYTTLPPTVSLPTGTSAATLTVEPVDDADLEATEGAVLQLGPGAGYVVGTPDLAFVTIADDDTLVSVLQPIRWRRRTAPMWASSRCRVSARPTRRSPSSTPCRARPGRAPTTPRCPAARRSRPAPRRRRSPSRRSTTRCSRVPRASS